MADGVGQGKVLPFVQDILALKEKRNASKEFGARKNIYGSIEGVLKLLHAK